MTGDESWLLIFVPETYVITLQRIADSFRDGKWREYQLIVMWICVVLCRSNYP
jgi:hypothetical protein